MTREPTAAYAHPERALVSLAAVHLPPDPAMPPTLRRLTAPTLVLLASACSLLEEGPAAAPEPPQPAAAAPAAAEKPAIELHFPSADPSTDAEPRVEPRVRVLYRASWTSTTTDTPVDILGVDVDRKEAWLTLRDHGRAFALDHITLDTGRRLERWEATHPARLAAPADAPWLPLSGSVADLPRFASIVHRVGPWSTAPHPATTEQVYASPDGQHVAWPAPKGRDGGLVLQLSGADGARPRPLAPELSWADSVVFSPGSDQLALRACRGHTDSGPSPDTCRLLSGALGAPPHVHNDVVAPRELRWASRGDHLYTLAARSGRDCLLDVPATGGAPARTITCAAPDRALRRAFITGSGLTAVLIETARGAWRAPIARWLALRDGAVLAEHPLPEGRGPITLAPDDTLVLDDFTPGSPSTATLHLIDQTGRSGELELDAARPLQGLDSTRWVEQEVILVRWTSDALFEIVGVKLEPYVLRTLGHHREP